MVKLIYKVGRRERVVGWQRRKEGNLIHVNIVGNVGIQEEMIVQERRVGIIGN